MLKHVTWDQSIVFSYGGIQQLRGQEEGEGPLNVHATKNLFQIILTSYYWRLKRNM